MEYYKMMKVFSNLKILFQSKSVIYWVCILDIFGSEYSIFNLLNFLILKFIFQKKIIFIFLQTKYFN